MSVRVWFAVLGDVHAYVDGQAVHVDRAQRRAVIAYLVLNAGQAVSTAQLVEALWGGAEPSTATTQVHNAVSAVRRALAEAAGRDLIRRGPGGYRLDVTDDEVDASVFADLVRQARRQPPEQASTTLRRALELWRGSALSGVSGAFVEPARATLEQQRADAWESLFAIELELGRHREIVQELVEVTASFPLRQKLVGGLMLGLFRCGRQPEALAAYRSLRGRLAADVGTEPDRTLVDLHRRILANDPSLSRLPVGQRRRFLPPDLPDFTGRALELEQLDRFAGEWPHAVGTVVVAGVGGIGKTTLAVHWAATRAAAYPDGQLYLDLRGFDESPPLSILDAVSALLRALGVPGQRIPVAVDDAVALYRSTVAGQRLLILLDNAHDAAQVRPLLPTGPGSLALVTSRQAMSGLMVRDGARRIMLPVLTPAESMSLLERIVGPDRVATEAAAATDLSDLCGHLPLALRIAAAHAMDRTIEDVVTDLSLLDPSSEPDLQLHAVFDRSYRALPVREQRTLRLLGLAPGPDISVEAVAALTGHPAEESLAALADATLVSSSVDGRYGMHDLVRAYAAGLTAEDVTPLFAYYLRKALSAVRAASPQTVRLPDSQSDDPWPSDAQDALAWLAAEQRNLVAVIESAAGPIAWRLADALRGYFWIRRDHNDWIVAASAGLSAATAANDALGQAAMHLSLGIAYRSTSQLPSAVRHLDQALCLARETGWTAAEASALGSLAIAHAESGAVRKAILHFEEALGLNRRLGRTANIAVTVGNIGGLRLEIGDLRGAAERFIEAQQLYRDTSNLVGESIMMANLAIAYTALGRLTEARELLDGALPIHQRLDDRSAECVALLALGEVNLRAENLKAAQRYAQQARAMAADIGDQLHHASATLVLAHVARVRGRLAEARQLCTDAVESARLIGHRLAEGEGLDALARVCHGQGERTEALDHARAALRIGEEHGYEIVVAMARTTAAEVLLALGSVDEARVEAQAVLEISERTGYHHCVARARSVWETCGF